VWHTGFKPSKTKSDVLYQDVRSSTTRTAREAVRWNDPAFAIRMAARGACTFRARSHLRELPVVRVTADGASGFIGSHVARLLVREGCESARARSRPAPTFGESTTSARSYSSSRATLRPGDPRRACRTQAGELHPFGWYATPGLYLRAPENVDLMAGTLKLAMRLAETGCRRFVGVGTCFEVRYGRRLLE